MKHPLREVAVAPLIVYQHVISPALGVLVPTAGRRCRYEPSCSHYAVQAIREFGILRGLVLAGWRLLRCNPFSPGGFDPVTAQHLFPVHTVTTAEAARPRE
ncbi:MAG: membrane protein insertion efficiency factor YidD [Solirubrobacteraceae bacterium]